jgi:hypothetical protein
MVIDHTIHNRRKDEHLILFFCGIPQDRNIKALKEKVVNSFENSLLLEGITLCLGEISIFLEKISVIIVYRSDVSNC